MSICYSSGFVNQEKTLEKSELLKKYKTNQARDFRLKYTSLGIHRDDYLIGFDNGHGFREAKVSTSQGQKRSIALSLKFAAIQYIEAVTGVAPILLLDDVESELDRFRKKALFWKIADLKSQVIITATEISKESIEALQGPEIKVITDGKIETKSH